ncbi:MULTISPECIES: bile acid:sodium symporter family protein [unclassified Streptomyces]|uniref:bile acid:sodium symporter family protein n=1 Tax=unclassified Streptomyces TaxID=2593676 RepID=UPI0022B5F61D|nr:MULTISPECIES: bile acid:sodium symporter [unclassified Streptomyces]MCZ7416599.1 bile acid:sodium symporter [Streptomyces sp. WMMC897]MCZ7433591.1 bile acid:sodium symporter [Streptomyces sp. WMMC1477]
MTALGQRVEVSEDHPLLDNALIDTGLPIALFVIMIGIGLSLTRRDFGRELRAPRGALAGTVAQLLLMPLLGVALAWALALPAVVAVGLVIIAACPGGTTSNLIAYLARGNVALSIVLTIIASAATIVTLPVFANLALDIWPVSGGGEVRVPVPRTIALLLVLVLLPLLLGMAIRTGRPRLADAMERAVSVFGGLVLAALVAVIAVSLGEDSWEYLRTAGAPALLLNLGGLGVGFGVMALAGLPWADRMTGAVELGVKNATIGILIAVTVMGQPEMAVPSGVYGLLMNVSAFALIWYGRRRTRAAGEPAAATGSSA